MDYFEVEFLKDLSFFEGRFITYAEYVTNKPNTMLYLIFDNCFSKIIICINAPLPTIIILNVFTANVTIEFIFIF